LLSNATARASEIAKKIVVLVVGSNDNPASLEVGIKILT